ncbi:MAG: twin-arginine translocase subunit TatC, partial [Brachybacterium sp.]|nr:twin-arginine translocase subunit TatC [Brachybacterium sp.]
EFLQRPFVEARARGLEAELNFQGVGTSLNVKLQLSAYIGLILSAPMIMYQAWMYIMPGLHKNERRYALGFFSAAVPLFFVGCAAGYWIINRGVPILMGFIPGSAEVAQIVNYDQYLNLLVKAVLAFGIAFTFPVVLVLLNFLGILPARTMIKAWRWVIFLCFLFTAIMVPTPDPGSMLIMAIPMCILFFGAVGIAYWNDRRRGIAGDAALDDDEASSIDDEVEDIGRPSSLSEADER